MDAVRAGSVDKIMDRWFALLKTTGKKPIAYAALGGVVFLFVFSSGFSEIDDRFYSARDDGVITMSHGRNLIDHGFIGVAPSGGRVEGFSAPAQFMIFTLVYALTGISYQDFAAAQTSVCTFLLGAVFFSFFRRRRWLGLLLGSASAWFLAQQFSFLAWHGSGMENAVTHVLFAATALVLVEAARAGDVHLGLSLVVFLATISRLESVVHIAPLLVIFSAWWWVTFRNFRALQFSMLVFLWWLLFHGWRWFYFGDLTPNTAAAQEIVLSTRLEKWWAFDGKFMKEAFAQGRRVLTHQGGWVLLAFAPLALFTNRKPTTVMALAIVASLLVTSYLHAFIFGPARLDKTRTTTQLAVFVPLGISFLLASSRSLPALALGLLLTLPAGVFAAKSNVVKPRDLCCAAGRFEKTRRALSKVALEHELPRPAVATPDLGALSWHKAFNIVDLGLLGTPMMAKLRAGPALSEYFFEYVEPDLVQSNAAWSCRHQAAIFSDPRFEERYQVVRGRKVTWGHCGKKKLPVGIYQRRAVMKGAPTAERRLIDVLAADLAPEHLRKALDQCQLDEAAHCAFVARTAFRFRPEFQQAGVLDDVRAIFVESRTQPFDIYLLNAADDGQAYRNAYSFLFTHYVERWLARVEGKQPLIVGRFQVFEVAQSLVFFRRACTPTDAARQFRIEFEEAPPTRYGEDVLSSSDLKEGAEPKAPTRTPKKARRQNRTFSVEKNGFQTDRGCLSVQPLPAFALRSLFVSQRTKKTVHWEGRWHRQTTLDEPAEIAEPAP